jgi:osmotically inducible lipoprotein OsmB
MTESLGIKRFGALFLVFVMLVSTLGSVSVSAQRRYYRSHKKHSTRKGALIGGATGLIGGAIFGGGKGALIGAGAGAATGYLIQRHRNHRRHRRHRHR